MKRRSCQALKGKFFYGLLGTLGGVFLGWVGVYGLHASETKVSDFATVILSERTVVVQSDGRMETTTRKRIQFQTKAACTVLGTLAFGYNEDIENVELKEVSLTSADGKVINFTPTLSEKIQTQVTGLQVKKKVFVLPQCEGNEILDYTVVTTQSKPLIPGHYFSVFVSQDLYPVKSARFSISVPHTLPFYYMVLEQGKIVTDSRKKQGKAFTPTIKKNKETKTYTWEFKNQTALPAHKMMDEATRVIVGSAKSWEEVGMWFREHYDEKAVPDETVTQQAHDLTMGLNTQEEKLRTLFSEAAQLAYVAEELGMGALLPRPCPIVLNSRMGDCKDKITLLRAFLKTQNIESYPALLHTGMTLDIWKLLPTPYYFNHVVLAVPDAKGYRFFDPTLTASPYQVPSLVAGKSVLILKAPVEFAQVH